MPRNSHADGVPASLIAQHGHVVGQAMPVNPGAQPGDLTTTERVLLRAITQIRTALGLSVYDPPETVAHAVAELVRRNGAPSSHGVDVPIGGHTFTVPHQVAAELSRMRTAIQGSAVMVQVALDLRDEAVDLVDEAVGICDALDLPSEEWIARARKVGEARSRDRSAAGEG